MMVWFFLSVFQKKSSARSALFFLNNAGKMMVCMFYTRFRKSWTHTALCFICYFIEKLAQEKRDLYTQPMHLPFKETRKWNGPVQRKLPRPSASEMHLRWSCVQGCWEWESARWGCLHRPGWLEAAAPPHDWMYLRRASWRSPCPSCPCSGLVLQRYHSVPGYMQWIEDLWYPPSRCMMPSCERACAPTETQPLQRLNCLQNAEPRTLCHFTQTHTQKHSQDHAA